MNKWPYGEEMLEQGDIESLDEWSDDKEFCCSIMDEKFDYLWDFENGIHFIDRLYSDFKDYPDFSASFVKDKTMIERIEKNEAELWFNNFDEVKQWIEEHKEYI